MRGRSSRLSQHEETECPRLRIKRQAGLAQDVVDVMVESKG